LVIETNSSTEYWQKGASLAIGLAPRATAKPGTVAAAGRVGVNQLAKGNTTIDRRGAVALAHRGKTG
jgi:hypothetical protein